MLLSGSKRKREEDNMRGRNDSGLEKTGEEVVVNSFKALY
jgi:hypothetical protein